MKTYFLRMGGNNLLKKIRMRLAMGMFFREGLIRRIVELKRSF
ncbi:hypothetical protein ACFQ9Y_21840 [Peribacillus simplex]